jgi:iron complex outermembrane receptor protein
MTLTRFVLSVIALAVAPIAYSWSQTEQDSTGYAESDSVKYEIDEVVVIGTRATERIIDIPYSVFKVDKKELGLGRKVSAKDVLADVPGLFLQNRYGNSDLRISIRGFGTRSNSGVRGVRILQDGIPESEPDGETVVDAVDFTSLGGVEVVKGNLSSLYANAPGGVINFVSDLYFPDSYVASTNQVGKFGLRQNGFRLGLKGNDSRFLLSYNYRNLDGYREHSSEFMHLANMIYETYLSKATVTISGNYVNSFIRLPGSLTAEEFAADPFQANPLAKFYDFKRGTRKGRLAVRVRTPLDEANSNELEVTAYGGIKELEKADNELYSLSTRYSLGGLVHVTNRSTILDRKNVLTFGMDYAYQNGPISDFDNLNGTRGISLVNAYIPTLSNIGFYFLDHFTLITSRLDLFVSGRFDRDVFSRDISIPSGTFTDTTRQFAKFTPKAGVNLKLSPVIALYASYGIGYDFPALSELTNTPLSSNFRYSLNPDLNAQTSKNFEVGIKGNMVDRASEVMRKIFFEVTYFDYVIKDEIVPFVINQKTYFRNAARTNRRGVEIGFKSEPVEGIELVTNYTYTNFRYSGYNTTVYSPSGDTTLSYTHNFTPSVPRHIFNFILNYELEISEDFSGLLQWDCDYIARMYVNDSNSESVPPYFYGNVMAGMNMIFGTVGMTAYAGAGNLFDKRYVGFVTTNAYYDGRYRETGEPRSVYAGLRINYKI